MYKSVRVKFFETSWLDSQLLQYLFVLCVACCEGVGGGRRNNNTAPRYQSHKLLRIVGLWIPSTPTHAFFLRHLKSVETCSLNRPLHFLFVKTKMYCSHNRVLWQPAGFAAVCNKKWVRNGIRSNQIKSDLAKTELGTFVLGAKV